MVKELDKEYEQELTIADEQNQQYQFDKDEENLTQQELITNLQNNNQQYKFDIDVEETNSLTYQDLKDWRNQAEELGRSQEYLDKIDKVVDYAAENPENFAKSNTESVENAMQQDREEFKQLQEQQQQQEQNQSYSIKARRR